MSGGRGPDACIDAVGMEAHGTGPGWMYDRVRQAARMEPDRPTVLRQVIQACRKGRVVSLAGVYGGFVDKLPMGAAFNKSLVMRMGQVHVQHYMRPLFARIEKGEIDPSFVITHRLPLDAAADGYRMFREKQEGCIKVVLHPWSAGRRRSLSAAVRRRRRGDTGPRR